MSIKVCVDLGKMGGRNWIMINGDFKLCIDMICYGIRPNWSI